MTGSEFGFGFGPQFSRWAVDSSSKIAITGASGWLGMAFAAEAIDAGFTGDNGRLRLFASSPRIIDLGGRSLRIEALDDAAPLGTGDWLFMHLAYLGKERTEDLPAAIFRTVNDRILSSACALAGSAEGARMIFASSGASSEAGPQDRSSPADAYGLMKREHEIRVAEWCQARSVALAVPRIFNIGGPYINKRDRYALSSIVQDLLRGQTVHIGAKQPVFRSYVHVRELVAVMAEACFGHSLPIGQPFDTAGREIVELADLAATAAGVLGVPANIERDWRPAETPNWYVGNAADYMRRVVAMGRSIVPLDRIIADTAAWCASARPRES